MSKLSVDQKSVSALINQTTTTSFLIPDYQRPYAWTEDECATLWDDIEAFCIPEGNADAFDPSDEYFLGPIVTFRNDAGQLEVIDGQQRLTTLMLLLRAFYEKFQYMQDPNSKTTFREIAQCIWRTTEFGDRIPDQLRIDSEVASDDDKDEFRFILNEGKIPDGAHSAYAKNYSYFEWRVDRFINEYPSYTARLANRILKKVILLPIEAESQDTALRIFSTLNDRGLPLADADIFKSQFYKYFTAKNEKEGFIERWKALEETATRVFSHTRGNNNPMDELFTRYMYYQRALKGIRTTTTEGLRDFYERDSYALLKKEESLEDLESLVAFWDRVDQQEEFSERVNKRLYVLSYAPNSMWTYIVSVYFLKNRDENGNLEEEKFFDFLALITGFIFAYAVHRPGVNALRTPLFPAMISIVNDEKVTFENYRFDRQQLIEQLNSFTFSNNRPITKSMVLWWAFEQPGQTVLDNDTKLEIEHIYSRAQANKENSLSSKGLLESLGNKAFLEKNINIRASDYRFEDKTRYYTGYTTANGVEKAGTKNQELQSIASQQEDFTEENIVERKSAIINGLIDYLDQWNLIEN